MYIKNLNTAFENACVFSKSDPIGCLFETPDGKTYLGCTNDTEHLTTSLFDSLTTAHKRLDLKNGVLYVTSNIDKNIFHDILSYGIKKVVYASTQKSEYEDSMTSNGIAVERVEKDFVYPERWWSDEFYDKAYDVIKDRKAPFTIISYNNPKVPTLKNFHVDEMTDDCNTPFIIFVRTSQKEMYEESLKNYKYVTVVDFPDELISNAGAVRRASQKWLYQHGYKIAFQGDDDCTILTYSTKGYKGDGNPKAQYVENTKISKVLAMWQLAMEEAIDRDNVYLSCSMPVGFSWKPEYCCSYCSYLLSRGSFTNIICWNVRGLVESGIFYRDNPLVGLDDIDMEIRVIESGHNLCNFAWLVNNGDPMSSGQSLEVLQARFKECQDKLRAQHEHNTWVHFRDKRNLPQVCVHFPAVRKWQKENGYRDTEEYVYNIWNDGELLNR